MEEGEWEAAIDRLYESVGDGQALANALAALRAAFDARGVAFLTIPDSARPQTFHIGAAGVSEQSLVEYHTHFNVHDEWVRAAAASDNFRPGAVFRGSELVPADRLRTTYFWREFLVRYRVADILTCLVEVSTQAGPSTFITFQRHIDQPPYAVADALRLASLAAHLKRVLGLHRRLAPALVLGATLRELVERVDAPLFFVAADGAVAERNPAATAALAPADSCVRLRAGRLLIRHLDGWHSVTESLAAMNQRGEPATVVALSSPSGRPSQLEIRRVSAYGDPLAPHPIDAICSLRVGGRDVEAMLRAQHGLTAGEALVVMQLTRGLSAAQVAQLLGVRLTTVRTHIHRALVKTGSTRQAHLVALALSG